MFPFFLVDEISELENFASAKVLILRRPHGMTRAYVKLYFQCLWKYL